jgi:excisionase family DNA binding protein
MLPAERARRKNLEELLIRRRKLRTPEAAEYTGIAQSTLEKLRVTGGGAPYIRIGRVVLYDQDDLDAWLAAHRRRSTSDEPNT